jgi:hypothetical protein
MDIRKYPRTLILSAALLIVSGIPGIAKDSRTVALSHEVVLSGTTLAAGKYVVRWEAQGPRTTVEFARDNQVVLSTKCKFEDRGKKYPSNTVLYDTAAGAP